MISVLIADDSIFIRKRITKILETDRRIQVVGTAKDGADAIDKIKQLNPDVITLDVEMPVMNGLEALEEIVQNFNIPVVMLSALTKKGAEVTLRALEMGAIDFIAKPSVADEKEVDIFSRELILKIRAAALARTKAIKKGADVNAPNRIRTVKRRHLGDTIDLSKFAVAIGISTGGPKTLLDVIPAIPGDFPGPIFIAQHIPPGFSRSLAERLDSLSAITVREAKNGEVVEPGCCYLAPGGWHMTVMHMTLSKGVMIRITDEPQNALYKPSVDVLMSSVAAVYGKNTIGIVMTGMGRDGTKGIRDIKNRGGTTISEDESSCIVYGMPKSVEEAGLSDYVTPATEIPQQICSLLKQ